MSPALAREVAYALLFNAERLTNGAIPVPLSKPEGVTGGGGVSTVT
jgi:hypothetical protein